MARIDPTDIQTFEQRIPFIQKQIGQRKRTWTLTTMDFEEAAQIILIRVWTKYALFNPSKAPFEHWLNRTISNALTNLLRDNLFRWQRPCVRDGGCTYNLGGDACGYEPCKGIQGARCPLYAKWKAKKEGEYNIKASLTLENHSQEVNNMPTDSLDIEATKKVIDQRMLSRLSAWDRRIYRLVYVQHISPQEVSARLVKIATNRKTPLAPEDAVEYSQVLETVKMMKQEMVRMIKNDDLTP